MIPTKRKGPMASGIRPTLFVDTYADSSNFFIKIDPPSPNTKLKRIKEGHVQLLSQLGISDLETKGSEMLQSLIKIRQDWFDDPYNEFAKKFSLPRREKATVTQSVSNQGIKYISVRTKTGDEITVAVEDDRVSINLVVDIEQRIRFILD